MDDPFAQFVVNEFDEFAEQDAPVEPAPVQHGPRRQPGSNSALGLLGANAALPRAAAGARAFANSPTLPKTVGAIARGGTTIGSIAHGLYTGNPTEVISAPISGWAAGKGGYFLGQGMQSAARPIAGFLRKAAPIGKALGQLAAPQSVLDLAQMAEPERQDIGFLGMGASVPEQPAQPMTPEQQAAYEKTWQAKIGRLYGRMRR